MNVFSCIEKSKEELSKEKWMKKFLLFKEYLASEGMYPKQNTIYKNVNIGYWVKTQRLIYNNGIDDGFGNIRYRGYILYKEEIEKLNSIDFIFKEKTNKDIWDTKYNLLVEYLEESDGYFPEQNTIYKNVNLGNWLSLMSNVLRNGEYQKDLSIKYHTALLDVEQIEKLLKLNIPIYKNTDRIIKVDINNQDKMKRLRRFLILKLYEIILNNDFENSKEVIEEFQKVLK